MRLERSAGANPHGLCGQEWKQQLGECGAISLNRKAWRRNKFWWGDQEVYHVHVKSKMPPF